MKYLIGLGNYGMGDDGVGLRIVEHIEQDPAEHDFEAVEVGNDGIQLLTYFDEDTEKILVVDAVEFGGCPGEYAIFSPEDVETNKTDCGISTHEGDILKLIAMAQNLGLNVPAIRILAIQPEAMAPDTGLSSSLAAGFDGYVRAAIAEMAA